MVINTNPPDNDETVTRHVFYTAMSAALDNNTNALNAIGEKLDAVVTKHSAVEKEFRDVQTTIRTAVKIAVVLATLCSGVVAVITKDGISYMDRVEVIERWKENHIADDKSIKSLADQVSALKYRVNLLEEEVSELKKRVK